MAVALEKRSGKGVVHCSYSWSEGKSREEACSRLQRELRRRGLVMVELG